MKTERVYKLVFASVYPHYLKKTETKGRTKKEEMDTIVCWLTGYQQFARTILGIRSPAPASDGARTNPGRKKPESVYW